MTSLILLKSLPTRVMKLLLAAVRPTVTMALMPVEDAAEAEVVPVTTAAPITTLALPLIQVSTSPP